MIREYSDSSAFTLIELIIVVAIITIGAVISIPRITTGIDSAKFRGAISEVVTFLRNAHLDAVLKREDISVSVDYNENTLIRDDNLLFYIPKEIAINSTKTGDHEVAKYTFYNNGRGTGPRVEIVGSGERKATVYVDLISGLAKYDLD